MILSVYKNLLSKENYNFTSNSYNSQLTKNIGISSQDLDRVQNILDKIILQFITNYHVYLDLMDIKVSNEMKNILSGLKSSPYNATLYRISFGELVFAYEQLFYFMINNMFIKKMCLSKDEINFFDKIKNQ